ASSPAEAKTRGPGHSSKWAPLGAFKPAPRAGASLAVMSYSRALSSRAASTPSLTRCRVFRPHDAPLSPDRFSSSRLFAAFLLPALVMKAAMVLVDLSNAAGVEWTVQLLGRAALLLWGQELWSCIG